MLEKKYTEKTFTLEILYHVGVYENSIHFILTTLQKLALLLTPLGRQIYSSNALTIKVINLPIFGSHIGMETTLMPLMKL
ncbi:hypothetical protein BSPWISOXPB_6632 [uncultured Gammaproteobacteria bacterium]|nr:hypothetical protein BSPWISOXPB_6632 [uncultured Gammaproteobacteria bacterium]